MNVFNINFKEYKSLYLFVQTKGYVPARAKVLEVTDTDVKLAIYSTGLMVEGETPVHIQSFKTEDVTVLAKCVPKEVYWKGPLPLGTLARIVWFVVWSNVRYVFQLLRGLM